jgi:hypothetical protein
MALPVRARLTFSKELNFRRMFSGSYSPEDVTFLLRPVRLESTDILEKERLIQSGQRHYSEMISRERLPSERYLQTFHAALERERVRFARHLLVLAVLIDRARTGPITLVSLARAGTPVGVILTRVLRARFGRAVTHYSVSIIRDRGIDEVAVKFILDRHAAESVVFVDGWTGKGVIAEELERAIRDFNRRHGTNLDPGLYAVADLCGRAVAAATTEDYLIPSSVLGATISGLVSRSILNREVVGPGQFHGCLLYEEFRPHDLSTWFVDQMVDVVARIESAAGEVPRPADLAASRAKNRDFVTNTMQRCGLRDVNHLKPGIGEATRVLLRRVPHLLLLRDPGLPELAHLRLLAQEKNVPMEIDPHLPYLATALIRELD